MTVGEAVATFRLRLAGTAWDDDNQLSDEAIFKLLSDSLAIILARYKDRFYKMSDWLWSTYGVKLQMIDADMFPCVDIEHCQLLQSIHNIPEPLMGKYNHLFKVYNGSTELPQYNRGNEFDEYLKDKPSWELVNNKLRIHNTKTLKAVTIKTIARNFMDWYDKQYCPDEEVDCWDLNTVVWPAMSDAKMQGMCFDMALQSLGLTLNQLQQEPNQNQSH